MTEKSPCWLRCRECQHRWIGVYLPMKLEDFCRVVNGAACPQCGAGNRKIFICQDAESE